MVFKLIMEKYNFLIDIQILTLNLSYTCLLSYLGHLYFWYRNASCIEMSMLLWHAYKYTPLGNMVGIIYNIIYNYLCYQQHVKECI